MSENLETNNNDEQFDELLKKETETETPSRTVKITPNRQIGPIASAASGSEGGYSSTSRARLTKPVRRKKKPDRKVLPKLTSNSQLESFSINLSPNHSNHSNDAILGKRSEPGQGPGQGPDQSKTNRHELSSLDRERCIKISEILKNELYVGSKDNLFDNDAIEAFKKYNITTVISVLSGRDHDSLLENQTCQTLTLPKTVKTHKIIKLTDRGNENIRKYFDISNNLIMNSEGSTFIHCHKGISRSVTLCIAYFLACKPLLEDNQTGQGLGKDFKKPFDYVQAALNKIREARPIAEPNLGFIGQLSAYAEETKLIGEFGYKVDLNILDGEGDKDVNMEDGNSGGDRVSDRRKGINRSTPNSVFNLDSGVDSFNRFSTDQ